MVTHRTGHRSLSTFRMILKIGYTTIDYTIQGMLTLLDWFKFCSWFGCELTDGEYAGRSDYTTNAGSPGAWVSWPPLPDSPEWYLRGSSSGNQVSARWTWKRPDVNTSKSFEWAQNGVKDLKFGQASMWVTKAMDSSWVSVDGVTDNSTKMLLKRLHHRLP